LMAAMEAARSMGGDGRCSCDPGDPTRCGSPPENFEKAAHIGYMMLARLGDTDDERCNRGGCARGDYFMNFNVPFQPSSAPDPVIQMREMFDDWRAGLVGRPDAVQSEITTTQNGDQFDMTLTVKDWQATMVTEGIQGVIVRHASGSAQATDIGDVTKNEDGTYSVTLTPNGRIGIDRLEFVVDDGVRPVTILPLPRLDFPCDVLVKKTRAKVLREGVYRVQVKLVNSTGEPLEGHEVFVNDTSRKKDPIPFSIGITNSQGKTSRKLFVLPGLHKAVVISVVPPSPGGECLDRDKPGQRLQSETVEVP